MSFMSATEIFEPVVRELVASGAPDAGVYRTTRTLIEVLADRGWDDVEGSVALFTHPSVLEAANSLGYYAYDQIPENGDLSTALIRCKACQRRVRYRQNDGEVYSEVHATSESAKDVCAYSGKGPNGY